MSQTVIETEILSETYGELGIVRFKKAEKGDRGWWICLTYMAAMYPATDGEPFSLEKWLKISLKAWFNLSFEEWLNLNPQAMAVLDRFLEHKEEEIWGTT
jgi:hypothetical protein